MNYLTKNIRKIRYFTSVISLLLMLLSAGALAVKGLNWGLDFTGGMVTEVSVDPNLSYKELNKLLQTHTESSMTLTKAGEAGRWLIRYSEPENLAELPNFQQILHQVSHHVEIVSNSVVGSQVGEELVDQGGMALLISVLCILGYLCIRFEWRLASGALVALAHDVVLVLGFFAITGMEFNLTVFSAILAILGYSLNDSIIIADRIRELLIAKPQWSTEHINDQAVLGTFSRTMVTSGTTLMTIGALWMLGGAPLFGFSTAMFIGVLSGTWSSISIGTVLPEKLKLRPVHYMPVEIDDNP